MIYGIIASAGQATVGLPPPAPWEGPLLGEFNFVTGSYSWEGTPLTAGQLIDRTDWIGSQGLEVPTGGATAGAEILHAGLKSFLGACQFTAVLEIETEYVGGSRQTLLTISNGATYYAYIEYYAGFNIQDQDNVRSRMAWDDSNALSNGTFKVAATRIDGADLSISVGGNSVVHGSTTTVLPVVGSPMTQFFLGGWVDYTNDAVNIHSLKIYEAMADGDLPGLST